MITKSEKRIRSLTRNNARQALSFARALRATLTAEEACATRKITETEEYLGILRRQKAIIHLQVEEADAQIGEVKQALDSDNIPEISLSDNEDGSSDPVLPPTSDSSSHDTSEMHDFCFDAQTTSYHTQLDGHLPSSYSSAGSSLSKGSGAFGAGVTGKGSRGDRR